MESQDVEDGHAKKFRLRAKPGAHAMTLDARGPAILAHLKRCDRGT